MDIQIAIRLTGWMAYKGIIKLLTLEKKNNTFTAIKEVNYDIYHHILYLFNLRLNIEDFIIMIMV